MAPELPTSPRGTAELTNNGNVIIRFNDKRIVDDKLIEEMGNWLSEVAMQSRKPMIIDLGAQDFLSSSALNTFLLLDKKSKQASGEKPRFVNMRAPSVRETFTIPRMENFLDLQLDATAEQVDKPPTKKAAAAIG